MKGTAERIKASGANRVLLIQDTTDVSLNGHKKTKGLGYSSENGLGVQTHTCIAATEDGIPLGTVQK